MRKVKEQPPAVVAFLALVPVGRENAKTAAGIKKAADARKIGPLSQRVVNLRLASQRRLGKIKDDIEGGKYVYWRDA
jgi:hypothetical protein